MTDETLYEMVCRVESSDEMSDRERFADEHGYMRYHCPIHGQQWSDSGGCDYCAPDLPVDDSGEAEPHDPLCDCDECLERAETLRDDYEQARIHDE